VWGKRNGEIINWWEEDVGNKIKGKELSKTGKRGENVE
jgi:hypothetical protein